MMISQSYSVAVLGLGRMGTIFASKLVDAGHRVTVWNRTRERTAAFKGVTLAPSPRQAAQGADIVVAMLRDDEASRDVWLRPDDGAIEGLSANAIAIEMSTLQPHWIKALADQIAQRGASFIEAPVIGSTPQANAGQVIHFAGGDAAAADRAKPILAAWSASVHHVGPVGSAAVAKLAVNALFAVQVIGVAQYHAMLGAAGLSAAEATDLLNHLPVASPAAKGAAALMAAQRDDALFPIELVAKDLRYAGALANKHRILLEAAISTFEEAKSNGLGSENITAIRKLFEV